MDREKVFKKEMINNIKKGIKMSDNNKMVCFRDIKNFAGATLESCPPFMSSEENMKTILNKDTKNYFYEWVEHDSKVKPYYDIDAFFVQEDKFIKHKKIDGIFKNEEHKKELSTSILEKAKEQISKVFEHGELVISSSCGDKTNTWSVKGTKTKFVGYAVSYHIVVAGYECNVAQLEKFNELAGLNKLTGYDKSVYSDGQNFRALYSSKPNDKRVKLPLNYFSTPALHLIQSSTFSNAGDFTLPKLKNSPPSSPPQSPKKLVVENPVQEEEEEEMDFQPIIQKRKYDSNEIKNILEVLPDSSFEYEQWIKIGMAIHNVTEGDNVGFALFVDWSKKDGDNFDLDMIKTQWKYLDKQKNNGKNKVGMTTLKKLYEKYKPIDFNCSLEFVFAQCVNKAYEKRFAQCQGDEEQEKMVLYKNFYGMGTKKILEEMNNRLIFVKETGDYIILDKQEIHKDGIVTIRDCWYLKSPTKAKDHFNKEKFSFNPKTDNDKDESIFVDPFKLWCEWFEHREVRAIGFDPSDKPRKDIFNLWRGYNVSKEVADAYDEKQAQPILDIIKEIWCNNDEDSYEYVLNYFAHIIQKPEQKSGVLLALKSKQGGCKGIIIRKLEEIIGDDHYVQNCNADNLFGNFNGQLEGKVLVNLDEAFWGGDKKMEGVMKNKITEGKQTINKKNKEAYTIDCYANYIISTNNDWFAGTTEDDRRYYCLELNNKYSGRMTKEKEGIIKKVLEAPCEAFAKILYNRDLSNFNARIFKKTKTAQEQVERNWNSVKVWWNMVMKEGGFTIDGEFVDFGKVFSKYNDQMGREVNVGGMYIKNKKKEKKTAYCKDWIFSVYNSHSSDARKFSKSAFYRDLIKHCLGDDNWNEIRIQKNKSRQPYIIVPELDKCREIWNEQQEYDYDYGGEDNEWEEIDCLIDSDEE